MPPKKSSRPASRATNAETPEPIVQQEDVGGDRMDITVCVRAGQGLGPDPQVAPEDSAAFRTKVGVMFPGQKEPTESEVHSGDSPQYALEHTFQPTLSQRTFGLMCNEKVVVTVSKVDAGDEGETSTALGTVSLDLIGLLSGESQLGGWLELEGVDLGGEDPNLPDGLEARPMPGVFLLVSMPTPLFSEEEVAASNFITVGGDDTTMYSLPSKWVEEDGKVPETLDAALFDYQLVVHLPIPMDKGGSNLTVCMTGGELMIPEKVEGEEAAAAPDGEEAEKTEEDPASKEGERFPRIMWRGAQKCFVPAASMDRLKEMSEEEEPLLVEFSRTLKPPSETIDAAWNDQNQQKYKGDAWVSVSEFMVPGCELVHERSTLCKTSKPAPDPQPSGKTKKPAPVQLETEDAPDVAAENNHGVVFLEAKTYLKLPLRLARPILPKPPTPRRPSLAPMDISEARVPLPRFKELSEASADVDEMTAKTVAVLVKEYKRLYPGTTSASANMQTDFMEALATSGRYHTFKEILKKSVIHLVREKYKVYGNETPEELGNFFNNLYVYVLEKTSECLAHAFDEKEEQALDETGTVTNKPPEVGTIEAYVRMAEEAEVNLNMELAAKYRQECIVKEDRCADLWLQYALFSLRNHDLTKAEECLRESISLDSSTAQSLLVYAVVLTMRQSFEEAEVFYEAVLDLEPNSSVCWAVRGLVFDLVNKSDDALQAYAASRRAQEDTDQFGEEDSEEKRKELDLKNRIGKGVPLLQAAHFLLEIHATALADKALTLCQVHAGEQAEVYCTIARMYMQREDFVSAEENLAASLRIDDTKNVEAWTLRAHAQFLQGKEDEATQSYKKVLSINDTPMDNAVRLRYGELLINIGQPEELRIAKNIFLKACTSWSCSSSWLGVAIACFRLDQLDEAEAALVEANIADNQNGLVWAYTTLVCLRLNRVHEADHAFILALRLGIDRYSVLVELGNAYLAANKPEQVEKAFRRALKQKEDLQMRRTLAQVCTDLGTVDAAVEEWKIVSESSSSEEDRHASIKEIVKLLKGAKRDKEAAKYQKMLK